MRLNRVGRARLFDDLVRTAQHRLRDRQAQGLRGLEVDQQLEGGWPLYGQVTRLRALQDLIHVSRRTPEQILKVRAIGHESAFVHELWPGGDRREPILYGEVGDLF